MPPIDTHTAPAVTARLRQRIGVNSAIRSNGSPTGAGSIGLGFAIPVDLAKSVAAQLFDAYDDKTDTAARSAASTGWLRALGLIEEEE